MKAIVTGYRGSYLFVVQNRHARFLAKGAQAKNQNCSQLYNRARYYDSSTGEFCSRDPLEYVDGMSLTRGYMGFIAVDPLGLDIVVNDGFGSCKSSLECSIDAAYEIEETPECPVDYNPLGGYPPELTGRRYDASGLTSFDMHIHFFEFYVNTWREFTDVVVIGGTFLLDVLGQPELQSYIRRVDQQLERNANDFFKDSNCGTGCFCDGGARGILASLSSTNVRLALQGFTVYWRARCCVRDSGMFSCEIDWNLYDRYDFKPLNPYNWIGTSFHVTANWRSFVAGTVVR